MTATWLRPVLGLAGAELAGGPQIGRREGQRLARQELSEISFVERVLNWLLNLFSATANAVPGGWFGLVVLAVLAVLAVTVVIFWVRPTSHRRVGARAVLSGAATSAQNHRREAQRLAAVGQFGQAIVEAVRAVAVELEEREILPPRPGRTADELAHEAGRRLPALAEDMRRVTRLFDDVLYGERRGTEEGYRMVGRLDEAVRSARQTADEAARPAFSGTYGAGGSGGTGAGAGAPR